MDCNEVRGLLMPFFDGELDPAVAAEVEGALAGCPECSAELAELRLVHAFAQDAFTAPVAEVDLSRFVDGVMARIAAEEAETAAVIEGVRVQRAQPGLLDRLAAWFGELFRLERPLAGAVAMAAVIAVIAGIWFAGGQTATPSVDGADHPTIASEGSQSPGKRRGREGEVTVRSAWVEESIASVGEVKVIDLDGSDDQPLVLWHVVEGEGVTLPANGNGTGL